MRIRYRQASLCLDATHETLSVRVLHCPIETARIGFGNRIMELREGEEITVSRVAPNAPPRPATADPTGTP